MRSEHPVTCLLASKQWYVPHSEVNRGTVRLVEPTSSLPVTFKDRTRLVQSHLMSGLCRSEEEGAMDEVFRGRAQSV